MIINLSFTNAEGSEDFAQHLLDTNAPRDPA
jgi:hypothetical protein